jgi:hypothetical protein
MSTTAWYLEHFSSGKHIPSQVLEDSDKLLAPSATPSRCQTSLVFGHLFPSGGAIVQVKSVGATQLDFLQAEEISPASSSFENFQITQSALATLFLKLPFDFTFTANTSISKHASTTCSAWPHPSDAPPVMLLACAKTSTSDTVFVTALTPLAVRMSPAV